MVEAFVVDVRKSITYFEKYWIFDFDDFTVIILSFEWHGGIN